MMQLHQADVSPSLVSVVQGPLQALDLCPDAGRTCSLCGCVGAVLICWNLRVPLRALLLYIFRRRGRCWIRSLMWLRGRHWVKSTVSRCCVGAHFLALEVWMFVNCLQTVCKMGGIRDLVMWILVYLVYLYVY